MILVTGGTGFIGRYLVKNLLKDDYSVKLLVRDVQKARKMFPKADVVKGDILDKNLQGIGKVEKVIHLAGLVSYSKPLETLLRINAQGTKNLLDACKDADKFVFSSSVSVFGEIKEKADEVSPCRPFTYYGKSKLEAEKFVTDSGIPNLILRLAPVYGVGSSSWYKNLKLLEKGFPIPNTKNLTHVLHINNAIQAFSLGLKGGEGIYIIADKEPVGFTEFAETLVNLLGKKPKKIPMWFGMLLARLKGLNTYLRVLTMNRNYDITKAQKDLGYKPKSNLNIELKKMVEWYKTSGVAEGNNNVFG